MIDEKALKAWLVKHFFFEKLDRKNDCYYVRHVAVKNEAVQNAIEELLTTLKKEENNE